MQGFYFSFWSECTRCDNVIMGAREFGYVIKNEAI